MTVNAQKRPELLLPAGSWEQFQAGLQYGGDAFYLGGQSLSLRAKSKGFSWERLDAAVKLAHAHGKKIYFCLNVLAQEKHLSAVRESLDRLQDQTIDGLIVADPGVISLAQRKLPHIPLHLSTQANTGNSAAIAFWQAQGVSRINLARELDYRNIRKIRETCPDIGLEVFVHGAMCMAISGRCLLSSYLNQRSANLGWCAHPCRYHYKGKALVLEEESRPDQMLWEIQQADDDYTKILAADDLCLVKYLKWFWAIGMDALKVEGRTKSASYVAQVADVYSTALRDLASGQAARYAMYLDALQQTGDRDLTTGLLFRKPRTILSNQAPDKPVFAQLLEKVRSGVWRVQIKSQWREGCVVQVLEPGLQRPVLLPQQYGVEKLHGEKLSIAHSGASVHLCVTADDSSWQPGWFLRIKEYPS